MANLRVLLSVLGAVALAAALSACGSSSNATAAPGAGSSSSRYQARLSLAKCLRAHGLDVPDPSANGGPPAGGAGRLEQIRSSPNFQTAMQACQKQVGKAFGFANLTPAQRARFQQAAVTFARCMRAHNIDIPDPSSSGVGGFGIVRDVTPTERNSPAFQAAFNACQSNLPQRPGGGRGGPPPGP